MPGFTRPFQATLCALASLLAGAAFAEEHPPGIAVVISVAEQKLVLLRDGALLRKFPISTSKYGVGDSFGSYQTPLGRLRVCDKVGDDLTAGAVLKQRHATGEVLPVNAPGRDPIVTRILWLDGLEAQNENARHRGIYIHGTTEESRIGDPVSYGCIRMRSKDVLELFEQVPLEATVTILEEKLPRFAKYTPRKAPVVAAAKPPKTTPEPAKATPPPAPLIVKVSPPAKPAPIVIAPLSPPPAPERIVAAAPPLNPRASLAMQGSMLDAGLPQGPRISAPANLSPSAPAAEAPAQSAFSLRGISRDLALVGEPSATATSVARAPAKRIAFRAGETARP